MCRWYHWKDLDLILYQGRENNMKKKNSLVKIHMPIDDAYIMGKIPELKSKVNATIDKVKTIRYLCEESIAKLEELKEEMTKL